MGQIKCAAQRPKWVTSKLLLTHARSRLKGKHTTIAEHMPAAHRAHMEWTPGRLLNWGASVGPG
ncbi:hypothetical protein, partial [Burkholderia multivorans]|uniref:hypothetical protein n=1 Tax=Burkholderia multivorans TaxID=87883 RepID=UPI00373500E8